MITHLLMDESKENRVGGAVGFNMRTGDYYVFRAKTVIVAAGGAVERTGGTSAVFLSDSERKRSTTVIGKSFNLVSRTTTTTIATQITIIGNDTGGITTIPITVNANS